MLRHFYTHAMIVFVALSTSFDGQVNASTSSSPLPVASNHECSGLWEVFDSRPYRQPLFPDTNVSYWRFRFVSDEPQLAFRVSGSLPNARYMSLSTYDQNDFNSVSSLYDRQLALTNAGLSYEVVLLPDTFADDELQYPNVLRYPSVELAESGETRAELWYRVYLPADRHGGSAQLEPPRIEAFNYDTGETLECPLQSLVDPSPESFSGSLPPPPSFGHFAMVRPKSSGIYASPHNQYIAARLPIRYQTVTVFSFKPPQWSNFQSEEAQDDVRYWSLCVGGLSTLTSSCTADRNLRPGTDGFVRVAVGPSHTANQAKHLGYHFMPRGLHAAPVLMYRNLLTRPDFPGDFRLIEEWVHGAGIDPTLVEAQHFIGLRAPVGRHCQVRSFLNGECREEREFE